MQYRFDVIVKTKDGEATIDFDMIVKAGNSSAAIETITFLLDREQFEVVTVMQSSKQFETY